MRQTKRAAVFLLMLALLVSFLPVQAAGPNGLLNIEVHNEATGRYEPQQAEKVNIRLDGSIIDLTGDVPGLALGGRTMVPIRFVVEALGYQVGWDYPRQMVVVGRPGYPWDMESESAQAALIQADGLLKTYSSFV